MSERISHTTEGIYTANDLWDKIDQLRKHGPQPHIKARIVEIERRSRDDVFKILADNEMKIDTDNFDEYYRAKKLLFGLKPGSVGIVRIHPPIYDQQVQWAFEYFGFFR